MSAERLCDNPSLLVQKIEAKQSRWGGSSSGFYEMQEAKLTQSAESLPFAKEGLLKPVRDNSLSHSKTRSELEKDKADEEKNEMLIEKEEHVLEGSTVEEPAQEE